MNRASAHKLARLLRALGFKVRVRCHGTTWACVFYTVEAEQAGISHSVPEPVTLQSAVRSSGEATRTTIGVPAALLGVIGHTATSRLTSPAAWMIGDGLGSRL